MNKLTVVVDADALVALEDIRDVFHHRVQKLALLLVASNSRIIYPTTAICEAASHIQRVLNNNASAQNLVNLLVSSRAEIADVDRQTLNSAAKIFSEQGSKQNTIFDCVVVAVAKEKKADAILSWDKFYQKQGFQPLEELIAE